MCASHRWQAPLDVSAPRWQLANCVLGHWKELATREAQRLISLNEQSSQAERGWAAEAEHWKQYKARVQSEMRRDARNAAAGGDAESALPQARADLAEMKRLLGRAESNVDELKHERLTLEAELRRHREGIAQKQERLAELQKVL